MDRIVVIGDSHSQLFSNSPNLGRGTWNDLECDIFDVRWMGPVTYWRLCRDQLGFIDFNSDITYSPYPNMNISTRIDKDVNIFITLGEIDIRCNIHKYGDYTITIDNMAKQIDTFVSNFYRDFKIHLCSIVPPINRDKCISENKEFPFIGSDSDRMNSTLYFNNKLYEISKKYNLGYFDIHLLYKNSEGMMDTEKSDYIVHAKKTEELEKYIKEYVKKINLRRDRA